MEILSWGAHENSHGTDLNLPAGLMFGTWDQECSAGPGGCSRFRMLYVALRTIHGTYEAGSSWGFRALGRGLLAALA